MSSHVFFQAQNAPKPIFGWAPPRALLEKLTTLLHSRLGRGHRSPFPFGSSFPSLDVFCVLNTRIYDMRTWQLCRHLMVFLVCSTSEPLNYYLSDLPTCSAGTHGNSSNLYVIIVLKKLISSRLINYL